jgi:Tfp pilus assembly protein PilO
MSEETPGIEYQPPPPSRLQEWLRSPFHVRLLLGGLMLAGGYGGVFMPLDEKIDLQRIHLEQETKRRDTAQHVERLRAQVAQFQSRLPQKCDANAGLSYLLEGIRQFPLELIDTRNEPSQKVGPFLVHIYQIKVQGEFKDMARLVHWIETNPRLFRLDLINFSVTVEKDLQMQLTVLAMTS